MRTLLLSMKNLILIIACFSFVSAKSQTTETFSVMAYNLLKFPQENSGRVSDLKIVLQEALPDILMVCELTSASGANAVLSDALNQDGITYYEKSVYVPGTDTENMLYYNSNKFGLKEQHEISTSLRDINEYVLYYKSDDIATTTDTTFFYVYVCHLKAGSTASDITWRDEIATSLKQYMANRGPLENVLIGGDFNLYGSSEPSWNTLLNGEGITMLDPISTSGEWHDDWGYADVHTQSTRTVSVDNGASGGLDDRFDFIFISPDLQNWGHQAKYVDGTYWAYGQDGNHFNDSLTDAPTNTSLSWTVIQALYDMSDHLPVYLEIEVQKTYNGVEDAANGVSAFYNPKNKSVQFSFELAINWSRQVMVYDLSGKVVQQGLLSDDNRISVNSLENGIYILKAHELNFVLKFVK
ncbi:MAG: T9SS type A sorting domain-containing protein [Crocinitomicaceae bacterium]